MPEHADVGLACEQLVKALRDLAALASPNGSSSEAVAESVARVRSAARSYADAIGEVAGWDDVFADLEESGETDDEPFDGVPRLSLAGRWDFLVEDPAVLMRYVRRRLVEDGWDERAAAEHSASPSAALDSLAALDGWDVRKYVEQGLKTAGSGWTVRHVDRVLSEMSHAERWETGF
ncbi:MULTISPECIES: hypothetical protein [unclassified Nonomuraea]|uniref:hypothetical protein n=1 Tax=unclassified Nonomuraea TaxID=2593643 RepID=UPI0033DD70B1